MASLWAGKPDPKPVRRVRASQADWSGIHELFKDAVCVYSGRRPVELHHILPRSQGGDDVVVNLAPLTREAHTKLEGHETGWERVAAAVRQYVIVDNDRRRYQETHAGESFNRRYPPLANTDQQFLDDRAALFARHGEEIEGHSR